MMTEFVNVKIGNIIIADGGFTCIRKDRECHVNEDSRGLFVECDAGHHYLDGQLDDNGNLIGFRDK